MTTLSFLTTVFIFAEAILGIAMLMILWRALKGPRAQDRVMSLDALYVTSMLLLLVNGMRTGGVFSFEGAFVIALLGFVATVAMAKFLLRGEVIE